MRNIRINDSTFYVARGTEPERSMSPGQACKKLRDGRGVDAFRAAYGTNHNHRNAFGKCVSGMAHLEKGSARTAAVERITRAADRCLARATSGHGRAKGHGKPRGANAALRTCLEKAV